MKLKNSNCESKIFKALSMSGFHDYRIKFMSVIGENPAETEDFFQFAQMQ